MYEQKTIENMLFVEKNLLVLQIVTLQTPEASLNFGSFFVVSMEPSLFTFKITIEIFKRTMYYNHISLVGIKGGYLFGTDDYYWVIMWCFAWVCYATRKILFDWRFP